MSAIQRGDLSIHFPDDQAIRVLASVVSYADHLLLASATSLSKVKQPITRLILMVTAAQKVCTQKLSKTVVEAIPVWSAADLLGPRSNLTALVGTIDAEDPLAAQWAGIAWLSKALLKVATDQSPADRDPGSPPPQYVFYDNLIAFVAIARAQAQHAALQLFTQQHAQLPKELSACQLITGDPQNPHVLVGPESIANPVYINELIAVPVPDTARAPIALVDIISAADTLIAEGLIDADMDEQEWGEQQSSPAQQDSSIASPEAHAVSPAEEAPQEIPELLRIAFDYEPNLTEADKEAILLTYDTNIEIPPDQFDRVLAAIKTHRAVIDRVPEALRHYFVNAYGSSHLNKMAQQYADAIEAPEFTEAAARASLFAMASPPFQDIDEAPGFDLDAYIDRVTEVPGLVDVPCLKGRKPLHYVTISATPEQLKRFINQAGKLDIDHQDSFGNTAYHYAATTRERALLIPFLQAAGADRFIANAMQCTPFDISMLSANFPGLRRFLKMEIIPSSLQTSSQFHAGALVRHPRCPPDVSELLRKSLPKIPRNPIKSGPDVRQIHRLVGMEPRFIEKESWRP